MVAEPDLKQLKEDVQNALRDEDWTRGANLLKQWCSQRPADARGWYYFAYFLMKLGRLEEAEILARKSVSLDASNKSAEALSKALRQQLGAQKEKTKISPRSLWRKGALVDGRYLVRGSRKGGMGEVFFAFDRELDHMVAIKAPLLSVLENERNRARFYREAEAWIGLGIHPNICSAYYVQEFERIPWLFIEYVGGGTLQDLLRKSTLTFQQKLDTAIQIASGMNHTHTFAWKDEEGRRQTGLVHRDLKPANILMDRFGTARITDFGLVGMAMETEAGQQPPAEESLPENGEKPEPDDVALEIAADVHWQTITVAGAAVGTPPYMAPEQWKASHQVGFPADIYAFGIILYLIFCGQRPFDLDETFRHAMPAHKIYQWEKLHLEATPADPRALTPSLNERLAGLMLKCLEKPASARPESFRQIRDELKQVYHEEAGQPYPRPEPRASRLLADSLNNQGASFATIGQTRRAVNAWQEALRTDPHHIEAMFNMSLQEWKSKEITASEVYRRMEEVGRTHAAAWRHRHLMGRLHLYFGDYSRAADSLREASIPEEARLKVLKDLGLALIAETGMSEEPAPWKAIEACFSQLLEQGNDDPAVAAGYALALRRLGRPDDSRRFYSEAAARLADMPFSLDEAIHLYLPGQEVIARISHPGWVNFLGFGPQGDRVVCCGEGRLSTWDIRLASVLSGRTGVETSAGKSDSRLWNVKPSRALKEIMLSGRMITAACLAPDGNRMLTGDTDGLLLLRDVKDGSVLTRYDGHEKTITALVFSSDGRYFLSGSDDTTARLWETATGVCFETFPSHTGRICFVGFALDGKYAVSVSEDGLIQLFDSYNGTLSRVMESQDGKIACAALSPDSGLLMTAGPDKIVRLWDVGKGRQVKSLEGHDSRIASVAFSSNGGQALSAGHDRTLRVWSVESGNLERTFRLDNRIEQMAVSPDNSLILLSLANPDALNTKTLCLMEYPSRERYRLHYAVTLPVSASQADERETMFQTLLGKAREHIQQEDYGPAIAALQKARNIPGYERDPDTLGLWTRLCTMFPAGHLRSVWEKDIFRGHEGAVTTAGLSPDGKFLLTGARDSRLRLWSLEEGGLVHIMDGHEGPVSAAAFFGGSRFAVSGSVDRTLRLWDLQDGSCIRVLKETGTETTAIGITPDGRHGLVGTADENLTLWNLFAQTNIRLMEDHSGYVTAIAFSPDGLWAATGGSDRNVRLWETASGQCVRVIRGHPGKVTCLAAAPDGIHFLTGCDDGIMRRWNADVEEMPESFGGHAGPVHSVAVSPDNGYAATGGADRTVRIWDIKTGRNVSTIEGHQAGVVFVAFGPDRQTLVSAGQDAIIKVWRLDWEPDIRETAPWTEEIRPYLDVFLTLHTPFKAGGLERSGKPGWTQEDFEGLLADLEHCGYGWLQPKGVRIRLKEMARLRYSTVQAIIAFFLDIFEGFKMIFRPLRILKKPVIFLYKLLPALLASYFFYTNETFGLPVYAAVLIVVFLLMIMFAPKKR